jgi:hypothetical protein
MRRWCGVLWFSVTVIVPAAAQELEPRALINSPQGRNFVLLAAGYAHGNLLLDPAVPLEDGNANLGSFAAGYLRSISLFGLASKISVVIPFATGTWTAVLNGVDTSATRTGFGDPGLKLSVNFIGSPSLRLREFASYRQSLVVGASVAVLVPLGQYYPDKLINLSSNRWTFAPRLGASQVLGKWIVEGYATGTFFTTNHDFFGGKTVSQDPLFDLQIHLIRLLNGPRFWAAGSYGYAWGGRSTIDGVEKEPLKNERVSLVLGLPLARAHTLKVAYINGFRTQLGADFDTIQIAWQYAWGGKL